MMMTKQWYHFLKSLTLLSFQTGATAFWTLHFEFSTTGEAYRNGDFTHVCAAHIGLWEILYKQRNPEKSLKIIVADALEM